jgi:nucleotide-binding universal stress UspA family protein
MHIRHALVGVKLGYVPRAWRFLRFASFLLYWAHPTRLIVIKQRNSCEAYEVGENREETVSYKTILAHCNDPERLSRLLDVAATLSASFGAHLVGVSVIPPIAVIPAGIPGTPDTLVIDEHARTYRAKNPAMKAAFEKATNAHKVTAQWREEDAGSGTVVRAVIHHARTADLVVAAQTALDWQGSLDLDIADRLALESGRPVLIVPNLGLHRAMPTRIVVGWANRREASRAVFDALPLLQRADKVTVVEVDSTLGEEGTEIRRALCATLARHGVTCEEETSVSRHGNVGDALLAFCQRANANLLVMGCYGHSRLREFVLGGASRHVLGSMTLPVLMSH